MATVNRPHLPSPPLPRERGAAFEDMVPTKRVAFAHDSRGSKFSSAVADGVGVRAKI